MPSLTGNNGNYTLTGSSTGDAPKTGVTTEAIQNKSLLAGPTAYKQFQGDTLSSDPAVAGIDTSASKALSSYLSANPQGAQEQGIMDRYSTATGNVKTAAADTATAIGDYYKTNLNDVQNQNTQEQTSASEAQRGFATNTAALRNLQQTGDKRIRDLTNSRDAALLSNNAEQAKALTDLITQEQSAITTARQNWVSNLLGLSAENRAVATTQTPQQAAVLQFATQYPGAGILPTDTLDEAGAKAAASPLYKSNLAQIQAGIASAYASAGASNASAAQTRALTGFLTAPVSATDPDVVALQSGSATPQQITDKYPVSLYGGKAANIISAAQKAGYSLNQGTLSGVAQEAQVKAQNSGDLLKLAGLGISNLFGGTTKALTAPTTAKKGTAATGVTPSGIQYTINP